MDEIFGLFEGGGREIEETEHIMGMGQRAHPEGLIHNDLDDRVWWAHSITQFHLMTVCNTSSLTAFARI